MSDLPPPPSFIPAAPLTPEPIAPTPLQPGTMPPQASVPGGPEQAKSCKKPCCVGCGIFVLLLLAAPLIGLYFFWQYGGPTVRFAVDSYRAMQSGDPASLYTLTTPEFQSVATKEDFGRALQKVGDLSKVEVTVDEIDGTDGNAVSHLSISRPDGTSQPVTVWLVEKDGTLRIQGLRLANDTGPAKTGVFVE